MICGSDYIDVCSATGVSGPGYLPKDLPLEGGRYCRVESFTAFTGTNCFSGGVFDTLVLGKMCSYGSDQAFVKAIAKYPALQEVINVNGTIGRYKIYSGYPGEVSAVGDQIQQEARQRQLEPLAKNWPSASSKI